MAGAGLAGVAAVAAACGSDGDTDIATTGVPRAEGASAGSPAVDGSVLPALGPISELAAAPDDEVHHAYAPDVPPPIARTDQRVVEIEIDVIEGVCPLDPVNDVSTLMWGYRITGDDDVTCGSPGPVFRARVGDLVRVILTNLEGNEHPHNIDFHAITGQGGGAADLTALPGETKIVEARLLYPGAFMYHCAYGDVPEHIAKGMYGMFIVDPERPLPEVDHEWSIMQSEWYVGEPAEDGVAEFDRDALFAEEPRFVTFNGRTGALAGDNALTMQVGERARFFMVNQGLNLDSNFHPIGSHWDAVYPEAATHESNRVIRGSQSTLVVAGGGTVVELIAQVPSTLILVDHALVRTFYKGAIGEVVVEGEMNPDIFGAGASAAGTAAATTTTAAASTTSGESTPAADNQVIITEGAFDPANEDNAYAPRDLSVAVGTEVVWVNEDAIVHTVTAGESDGRVGEPSGLFDSGNMSEGDTFAYTFDEAGTFPYYCVPHPWMTGTITVEG